MGDGLSASEARRYSRFRGNDGDRSRRKKESRGCPRACKKAMGFAFGLTHPTCYGAVGRQAGRACKKAMGFAFGSTHPTCYGAVGRQAGVEKEDARFRGHDGGGRRRREAVAADSAITSGRFPSFWRCSRGRCLAPGVVCRGCGRRLFRLSLWWARSGCRW